MGGKLIHNAEEDFRKKQWSILGLDWCEPVGMESFDISSESSTCPTLRCDPLTRESGAVTSILGFCLPWHAIKPK